MKNQSHKKIIFPVVLFSGLLLLISNLLILNKFIRPKKINGQIANSYKCETFHLPILMYHYVEYVKDKRDTIRQKLNITPDVFEKQLLTLRNSGYTFITAKDLGDILDEKMTIPKKAIILTFDDGHRDFYTDVFPLLKKYNIRATAYIVPGLLEKNDFMTREQLKEVVSSNLVEIGAHSVNHISLKGKSTIEVENEIEKSKEILENDYKIKVFSFAYPYGAFDLQAINLVKSAGFTTSVSTIPGLLQNSQNRFFLYRLRPGISMGTELLKIL